MGDAPVEAKNNLRSRAVASVLDLIGEGQTRLKDGDKSIYLERTQLESGGKRNFNGVRVTTRNGTKNQTYIPGLKAAVNEINVGVQLTQAGGDIIRTITDTSADAVIVKIRVNGLSRTRIRTGDVKETEVKVSVWRKNSGGSYNKVHTFNIEGKTNSTYERQKRIELPNGTGPWDIKIVRETEDPDSQYLRNDTYFTSYTLVYDAKLAYPYSSLVFLEVDAKKFGSTFPERRYEVERINAPYPSNWNPNTRNYSGVWDGTFNYGTHDNPAWYLWELMTNDIFGLGDLIASSGINKWNLYTIAQYCDGMVKGKPRFTFNVQVMTRTKAIQLLDSIASVFRGMIYYSAGAIDFAQDRPGNPAIDITAANTIDGAFNRVGSARKARHTDVIVAWNNPKMLGDIDYVKVTRDDLRQKFGYRPKEVAAFGCTDETEARRVAEWILDTEEHEQGVVTWKASLDHLNVVPGMRGRLFDPASQGARFAGRVLDYDATAKEVTVDAAPPAGTYDLSVMLRNGTIETKNVVSTAGNVLTIGSAFSVAPVTGAIWSVASNSVEGEPVYITGLFEKAPNIWEVQAVLADPTKFARVERDVDIEHPSYDVLPSSQLRAPKNIEVTQFFVEDNGRREPALLISWLNTDDPRVTGYEYEFANGENGDWSKTRDDDNLSVELHNVRQGIFRFRVRSTSQFAAASDWLYKRVSVKGPNVKPANVENARINTDGSIANLRWRIADDPITFTYEVRFSPKKTGAKWSEATVVEANISKQTAQCATVSRIGTFLIKGVSSTGVYSNEPATVVCTIDASDSTYDGTIDESADWFGLSDVSIFPQSIIQNFNALEWVYTQLTAASALNLRETPVNSVHRAVLQGSIHANDAIGYIGIFTPVGSRNVRVKLYDNLNNHVTVNVNLATQSILSQSNSGFTSVSTGVTNIAGNSEVQISFESLEQSESIFTEITMLSGSSDTFLGNASNGVNLVWQQLTMQNQQLIENGSGELELAPSGTGYRTTGYYEFAADGSVVSEDPSLTLPKKTNIRFNAAVEYTVSDDGGVIGDLTSIGDATSIGGNTDGITINWQVRAANTAYNYGEWQDLTDALFEGRYFQFRFTVTSTNPRITPAISSAIIYWDAPNYMEGATDVSFNGTGWKTITYQREFIEKPAINVTPQTKTEEIEFQNRSTTGFDVRFKNNSGTVVARDFDWTAKGFGPVIP